MNFKGAGLVGSGRVGIRAHFQDKPSDLKVRCEREALKRLAGVCAMLNTVNQVHFSSKLTPDTEQMTSDPEHIPLCKHRTETVPGQTYTLQISCFR